MLWKPWMTGLLGLGSGAALIALLPATTLFQPAASVATGPAAVSGERWACPMMDFIGQTAGDCPVCGMKLVPMEAGQAGAGAETGSSAPAPAPKKKRIYRSTMNPGEVSATDAVISATIWLRIRAEDIEVGHVDGNSYQYADMGAAVVPNDNYRRILVSKTILLRKTRT